MLVLFFFAILSYFNHFSADDFYYMGCHFRGDSPFTCMHDLYENYSGRWSAYLLTGYIVGWNEIPLSHFIFNAFTFFILILIITIIIKKTFEIYFNQKNSYFILFTYSLLLVALLFFSTFGIGETWFWLIQVCTYLWGLILFLAIVAVFLHNKNHWVHYLLLALVAFITGGGSESYSLNFIFLLTSFLFFTNFSLMGFKINPRLHQKTLNIQILVTLIFLLAGFIITMLAAGNSVRYEALPKTDNVGLILVQLKSFAKIFIHKIPSVFPYLLLFGAYWFFIGRNYAQPGKEISFHLFIKKQFKISCLIATLIFIFLIPTSVIMVELGPDRALSIISFTLAFYTAYFFFDAGRNLFQKRSVHFYHVLLISTTVVVMVYQTVDQYITVKKYDEAFETRMKKLIELKETGNTELIELAPLPSSGMLYSAEISEDKHDFRNRFLRESLGLEFEIRLNEK